MPGRAAELLLSFDLSILPPSYRQLRHVHAGLYRLTDIDIIVVTQARVNWEVMCQ